eukprot:m.1157661 g.1157661  ORF g.1157661 m.1157661 type:complete len:413 (-) comp24498_c0_seq5:3600-4838(-)
MSGAKRNADDCETAAAAAAKVDISTTDREDKRIRLSSDGTTKNGTAASAESTTAEDTKCGDEDSCTKLADADIASNDEEPTIASSTADPKSPELPSHSAPRTDQAEVLSTSTVTSAPSTPLLATKVPLLKSPVSLMGIAPGIPHPSGRSGGLIPTPGSITRGGGLMPTPGTTPVRSHGAYPHPPTDVPIPLPVHHKLDELFACGKLQAGGLDLRILNTLARLPLAHGVRCMEQFSAALLEGVAIRNLNGFLAGIMRRYQSSTAHPAMAQQTHIVTQLPQPLQQRVDMLHAMGRVKPGDLDEKILLQITEFGDAWASEILSRFEESDLSKVQCAVPVGALLGVYSMCADRGHGFMQPTACIGGVLLTDGMHRGCTVVVDTRSGLLSGWVYCKDSLGLVKIGSCRVKSVDELEL